MLAFVITATDVIQHQAALAQMPGSKFLLDARLTFQQPIHGLIQLVFRGLAHPRPSAKVVLCHCRVVACLETLQSTTQLQTNSAMGRGPDQQGCAVRLLVFSRYKNGTTSSRNLRLLPGPYGTSRATAAL